jgi:hypothetical protein
MAKSSQDRNSTNDRAKWCVTVIQATAGSIKRGIMIQASSGIKQDPISKRTNPKSSIRVAQW